MLLTHLLLILPEPLVRQLLKGRLEFAFVRLVVLWHHLQKVLLVMIPSHHSLGQPVQELLRLLGANATDDWHGHLRESLGGAVAVER